MATEKTTTEQLPPSVRAQILADYREVNNNLEGVLKGAPELGGAVCINATVVDNDYIHPTTGEPFVPFDNPSGEYQYFSKIREALEAALTTGRIPRRLAPPRAPKYISDLVK